MASPCLHIDNSTPKSGQRVPDVLSRLLIQTVEWSINTSGEVDSADTLLSCDIRLVRSGSIFLSRVHGYRSLCHRSERVAESPPTLLADSSDYSVTPPERCHGTSQPPGSISWSKTNELCRRQRPHKVPYLWIMAGDMQTSGFTTLTSTSRASTLILNGF